MRQCCPMLGVVPGLEADPELVSVDYCDFLVAATDLTNPETQPTLSVPKTIALLFYSDGRAERLQAPFT